MDGMRINTTDTEIARLLNENDRRNSVMFAHFDPITGEGSIGERVRVCISDFAIPVQWIPVEMMDIPMVEKLVKAGSIDKFLTSVLGVTSNEIDYVKVSRKLIRLRFKHDFPFWAATLVYIHNKKAGKDVLFRLYYPQRILVSRFEAKRKARQPIRLILLKARQWGGSTTTQLYMAWLQFNHRKGLNSLIIAHQGTASDEIKDMFDLMISKYPVEFLHKLGETYSENEPKLVGVGKSGSTHRVPQRNCKIKVGTAESPDGCRGGAYSLVHLSEVGLWKKTDGKSPQDIVRSACSGMLLEPFTMIVMESTANGTGNFFHTEYTDAADPSIKSQYEALFIAWFQIEQYSKPFTSTDEKKEFAQKLYANRENAYVPSNREESGQYLWSLWEKGATLEAINWYVEERAGRADFGVMASEYPSDDVEAFVHSGSMVFDKYLVKKFEKFCIPPRYIGDVYADGDEGKDALSNLRFRNDKQGLLSIWAMPEKFDDYEVKNRYLTVVDVGGRSNKADWSVIVVFDRISMIDGSEPPSVVAQWYGHCDIDRLAGRAVLLLQWCNILYSDQV